MSTAFPSPVEDRNTSTDIDRVPGRAQILALLLLAALVSIGRRKELQHAAEQHGDADLEKDGAEDGPGEERGDDQDGADDDLEEAAVLAAVEGGEKMDLFGSLGEIILNCAATCRLDLASAGLHVGAEAREHEGDMADGFGDCRCFNFNRVRMNSPQ